MNGHPYRDAPEADPWRRLMSITYEAVILFGVLFFFGYFYSALAQFKGAPGALRWGFQAFLFLVLAIYFSYFWSDGRRTLPMKTMALVLSRPDGAPVSGMRALSRFVLAIGWLSAIGAALQAFGWAGLLLLAPLAWPLFDRHRRAWYDVASGTRLRYQPVEPIGRRKQSKPGPDPDPTA